MDFQRITFAHVCEKQNALVGSSDEDMFQKIAILCRSTSDAYPTAMLLPIGVHR